MDTSPWHRRSTRPGPDGGAPRPRPDARASGPGGRRPRRPAPGPDGPRRLLRPVRVPGPVLRAPAVVQRGPRAGLVRDDDRRGTLDVYRQTQLVDLGFILATAVLFGSVATLVARAFPAGTRGRAIAAGLWWIALVGPGFDVAENLVSFVMLADPDAAAQPLAVLHSTFAAVKFLGFVAVYLGAVVGLLLAAGTRIHRRSGARRAGSGTDGAGVSGVPVPGLPMPSRR